MSIFRIGNGPDISSGLMNLNSVKQMLFCISQDESSVNEMNAYTLLGVSNILEHAGYEIEQTYNELYDDRIAAEDRHMKFRADLVSYLESEKIICKSAITKILADNEKEN